MNFITKTFFYGIRNNWQILLVCEEKNLTVLKGLINTNLHKKLENVYDLDS